MAGAGALLLTLAACEAILDTSRLRERDAGNFEVNPGVARDVTPDAPRDEKADDATVDTATDHASSDEGGNDATVDAATDRAPSDEGRNDATVDATAADGRAGFLWFNNFDTAAQAAVWSTQGAAGVDNDRGWAYSVPNNGWVNTENQPPTVGNILTTTVNIEWPNQGGLECGATATIWASANLMAGYFDVWANPPSGPDGCLASGVTLQPGYSDVQYQQYTVPLFYPSPNTSSISIEFWAVNVDGGTNMDGGVADSSWSWFRIDDVSLFCQFTSSIEDNLLYAPTCDGGNDADRESDGEDDTGGGGDTGGDVADAGSLNADAGDDAGS
jgi:hypothetical protein